MGLTDLAKRAYQEQEQARQLEEERDCDRRSRKLKRKRGRQRNRQIRIARRVARKLGVEIEFDGQKILIMDEAKPIVTCFLLRANWRNEWARGASRTWLQKHKRYWILVATRNCEAHPSNYQPWLEIRSLADIHIASQTYPPQTSCGWWVWCVWCRGPE